MKTLWVVSGGTEAVAGIRRARELGLQVVVSDLAPDAPGFALAQARRIVSTYDVEATVAAALAYRRDVGPIHGVLSIAADVPLTTAAVAEALGLPGISVACAELASDKLAMKRRFARDGIPVPWFSEVRDAGDLRDIVGERGAALVLKPVDSRGARGVLQLAAVDDLDWAYAHAREHSASGRVVVEEFIDGPQISSESLVVDGVAHTPCLADRNYEFMQRFAPYVIENGGDLPSALPPALQSEVCALVERAARSLGVRDGVAKGDVVVGPDGPLVIEMAPRLSGGYLCTHEIPWCTGVDFVGLAIRLALGEKPDAAQLRPRSQRHVCQRWIFPEAGRVARVDGVERARALPGVGYLECRVGPGDTVEPLQSHRGRAGLVMTTGTSREQARRRAAAALSCLTIATSSRPAPVRARNETVPLG